MIVTHRIAFGTSILIKDLNAFYYISTPTQIVIAVSGSTFERKNLD